MGRHTRPARPAIVLDASDSDLSGFSEVQISLIGTLLNSPIRLDVEQGIRRAIAVAVAMEPAGEYRNHRRRFSLGVDILADDARRHGSPSPERAFAPSALDRAIQVLKASTDTTSRTTWRSDATRLARYLCPEQTPPRSVAFPRTPATAPATSGQVRALWDRAASMPPVTAARLQMTLALCSGAGARPEEAYRVIVDDITERPHHGGRSLFVDLANVRTGVVRTVPIIGGDAIAMLRQAKNRMPDGAMLLPRGNASNSETQDWLKEHGAEVTLSSRALRHYWICLLAQSPIPTASVMYLADLNDTQTLKDLRPYWSPPDIDLTARWVREALG